MSSVFLVQHLHTLPGGEEDVKIIGIYESKDFALAAVERASILVGFRDFPALIDPVNTDETDGFYIDELRLGEDHWTEGFSLSTMA